MSNLSVNERWHTVEEETPQSGDLLLVHMDEQRFFAKYDNGAWVARYAAEPQDKWRLVVPPGEKDKP